MTDNSPTGPFAPFETVGPEGRSRGERSRRRAVVAGVAVAVMAVLGGGAYAAYSFLDGGGAQPADVLPASTVAVVSVDLDPSAGQKIAALRSIGKFPALKKSLGLKADDDLREYVFDKVVQEAHCKGLDFRHDVLPWLGKRAALAAVDLGGPKPSPVIALQISDKSRAKDGFQALVDCTRPGDFGFAIGDDYLVGSDTAAHARAVLDQGSSKPLADDASYRKWTGAAGDPGVLSFYVAPKASDYLVGLLDDVGRQVPGLDGFSPTATVSSPPSPSSSSSSGALDSTSRALKDFRGLGGTVRFSDGGMELSIAGGGITQLTGLTSVGDQLADLPQDTAVALGFGVSTDYADRMVRSMAVSEGTLAEAEKETGLKLPEDLQTLLGHAVTLSVGGEAPASLDDVNAPADVPAGLVIHGDAPKIRSIIATLEDHLDLHLSDIPIVLDGTEDKVVLATSRGYADDLLGAGKLGSDAAYRAAVPNAAKANGVLFVDFDSPWRHILAGLAGSEVGKSASGDVESNTKALRSLGLSSWQDGDVSHALLKLTTD